MEKKAAEKILAGLKDGLFQTYGFCQNGESFCMLGQGRATYVYEVYEKAHPELHYALKIIGWKEKNLPSEKFRQVAEMQQKLGAVSEYIAKVVDYEERVLPSEQGGVCLQFILMEKLEQIIDTGVSGKAFYLRKELNEPQEKKKLILQIAQAVQVLQQHQILHRDIKLENIFYDKKQGCYKLGDFGDSIYTETGSADTMIYTDGYGAPEIEQNTGKAYDSAADMYSLGMVMYLLWNHLKFPGSDGYYVNPVQGSEEFLFPACEEGTTEWTGLIRKMCSYHKQLRPRSVEEVIREIHRIEESIEEAAPSDFVMGPDDSTVLYAEESDESEPVEEERYQKIGMLYGILDYYKSSSFRYGAALSIVFAVMLGALQENMVGIAQMDWQSQLMLCLTVIEIILLLHEELYILFGIGTLIAGIGFMLSTQQYVLYIVLLLGTLYGIPMVGIAGVAGLLLWNVLAHFGWDGYLRMISDCQLEWLPVTIALLLINREIMLRRECAACKEVKELLEKMLYTVIPLGCIALGSITEHTYLCIAGVIAVAVNVIDYVRHRNYPRLGEDMWNEYLDKRRR